MTQIINRGGQVVVRQVYIMKSSRGDGWLVVKRYVQVKESSSIHTETFHLTRRNGDKGSYVMIIIKRSFWPGNDTGHFINGKYQE